MSEHLALRFDWGEVVHSRVTSILGQNARTLNGGSANWDAVAIYTEDKLILLSVEADTDQIEISLDETLPGNGWEPISSFSFAIGLPLGWCWIGINSQGYKDSFSLAFGDVVPEALQPRCMFLAEASSLCCLDLTPRVA